MSFTSYQIAVASNPTTQFVESIGINEATANYDLTLPLRDAWWFIRGISIVSKEALQWELWLFTKADNMDGTLAGQNFLSSWQFWEPNVGPPATPGWPVTTPDISPATELYNYYVDGNMMPYVDLDQVLRRNPVYNVPSGAPPAPANAAPANSKLHVRLINRSASAKTAGTAGQVLVTFYVSTQGQQV